jgi:hypothetical protein
VRDLFRVLLERVVMRRAANILKIDELRGEEEKWVVDVCENEIVRLLRT